MPILIDDPHVAGGTIVLNRVWLNVVADPSDVVALKVRSFGSKTVEDGGVRDLAGGRLRWVGTETVWHSMTVVVVRPDAGTREWLARHRGVPVWVRDPDGGKFAGVYRELVIDRPVEGADATIVVEAVTLSEAV